MHEEHAIVGRATVYTTPYFRLVAKTLNGHPAEPFYALEMADYVTVLAVTRAEEILLVRQFRPVIEEYSLELPSGHVDPGEKPEDSARRELLEETGYAADTLELLGCLMPDCGRLANSYWCYIARDVQLSADSIPEEPGVERIVCPRRQWPQMLNPPFFKLALHIAVLQLALVQQKLPLDAFRASK
jgi:ADP-ribose pyrophosphatase